MDWARYCTNCGVQVSPDDAFCRSCGTQLSLTTEDATPTQDVRQEPRRGRTP